MDLPQVVRQPRVVRVGEHAAFAAHQPLGMGPRAGLIEHGAGLALGGLVDALLADQLRRFALCLLDEMLRLGVGLVKQTLPLGHDLARLL